MMNQKYRKSMVIITLLLLISVSFFSMIGSSEGEGNDDIDVRIENIDVDTISISALIPELETSTKNLYNKEDFAQFTLKDEGFSYALGKAKLPIIRRMVEIPQEAEPVIQINEQNWEYTSLANLNLPDRILPVQIFMEKVPETNEDIYIDEDYYGSDQYFPEEFIVISEINQIRGRRFALVELSPIQYNPATGDLKFLTSCEITLQLENCNIEKTIANIEQYSTDTYEELFAQTYANYGYYEDLATTSKNSEGYLIIVYDSFSDEIAPFASWKTSMGYDTTVVTTAEIPGGATKENIKTYIRDAYENWSTPPAYVLLVGDTGQIPAYIGTSNGDTDTYYVTMDEDVFADIHIGRFSATNGGHVDTMVEKTIYYEQANFPDISWIKKAAFIASNDWGQLAEETHDYVIETHMDPNGYTSDTIYEASGGNTQDIYDSLNDGRSLCIYSGHGSTSGWGCVPFYKSDVTNLENDGMYPFVCSHACVTGDYSQAECFGETWIRVANKGAIAFWGSSINTEWDPDDIIERRVFDAWWFEGLDRIGQMTDKGMYDSYQQYGSYMHKFILSYNILGDPSVKIWSEDPVDYDIDQNVFDRGFPIRHAADGDWAGAQSFIPTASALTRVDIYTRKFGNPEFDLTIELREGSIDGTLHDTLVFTPDEIPSSWTWLNLDFVDVTVTPGVAYFVVLPPAPSGVTTSFGYEWGYAFGNQYDDGAFWFTRDGGTLWRDLPTSYEFTFRTLG